MIRSLLFLVLLVTLSSNLYCQSVRRAWQHEPAKWKESGNTLTETVPAGTDYWRIAHYGFIRDNGPFRFQEQTGDFEAKVRVSGHYHELYHQAGLMIRIDAKNWIKTGIEFVDGKQNISAVVTRDYSDWSVIPRTDSPNFIWLRLQRRGDAVQIEYSLDDTSWSMLRLAYFPPNVPVQIGMVAAAPGKQEFEVTFDHFTVGPLPPAKQEE
ncbi:MAG: hypothetical protein JWM43_2847 [Acidobacteriaceae bacterium]|nr:hypothetical protein [Acidobacteriaceae bacterium]